MIAVGGSKSWFNAHELAELKLPGLPGAKRKVNELAAANRWALKAGKAGEPLARPRAGRGGGLEYHFSVLPAAAVLDLAKRGLVAAPAPEPVPVLAAPAKVVTCRDQLWAWFERQPAKVKAEAARRLQVIQDVEAFERAATRTAAIAQAACQANVSMGTVWNWIGLIEGVGGPDRLPNLAPRRVGGGAEKEPDPELFRYFKSLYLKPEARSWAFCYRLTAEIATARGLVLPHLKTLQRKLEREVDPRLVIASRSGADALRETIPPQRRSVADLHALELVNIDGHRWDVFVRWPDGHIARPMMVAIQDVYSRKFLAWRISETESAVLTRLAFADLFRDFGIPDGCLLDNGRAFASKWITGGTANRFRFTVRPEEPLGLLTQLDIKIHWALPFRGSSKPIERGFGDFCQNLAKHPAFAGAYTGNHPGAKPENYGSKAIDLDLFTKVVSRGIAEHNAREGRRTEMAQGRSFDTTFAESYASAPIRRATPEQQRMALLAPARLFADRKSGALTFAGNRYYHEALFDLAGHRVDVKFDPDNLHQGLHVYRPDGSYLAEALCDMPVGFLSVDAAKVRAKREAELRANNRRQEELENLLSCADIAALLPDDEPEDETIQPTVMRPVRLRGRGAAAAHATAPRASILDRLNIEDLASARGARAPLRLVE
ncbi:MAG: hypothetical protein JWP35_3506 [Caulobacter sp.]|nr:hypothetical protein [Caulobacter sp.]